MKKIKIFLKKHCNKKRVAKHIDNFWNLDLLAILKYGIRKKNKIDRFFNIPEISRKYGVILVH